MILHNIYFLLEKNKNKGYAHNDKRQSVKDSIDIFK